MIELMVVLFLIGLTAALVMPAGLGKATNSAALDSEAQKLAGTLRLARQKAMTEGVTYRLKFTASDYVFYVNGRTLPAEPSEKLDKRVRLVTFPAPLTFDQKGLPSATGDILVLQDVGDSPETKTIEIKEKGTVVIK